MEDVKLGSAMPWGMCPECLERVLKTRAFKTLRLTDDAILVTAYCAHRESGATMIVRDEFPMRWHILTPIDALEWEQYLLHRVAAYQGMRVGLAESASGTQH